MSSIIRQSLTRIVPLVRSNVNQKATIVIGPPKNPMPFIEKLGIGGGMCILIVIPMFWILANIKNYKNPGGASNQ